eukprot:GILJ01001293.1.p1 GENE.GILJ01001293.1~~GILJ01001293.1.p1  ORF type:complete len:960 (-),score=188.73 GILJ01001293.1:174-3053(-)
MEEEEQVVKCLTAKELKALARPEFEANPEKFYPVTTMAKFGFSRAQCPKCNHFFWRHTPKKEFCGDCGCVGQYDFIGKGTGKGKKTKITYAEAWNSFKRSFTSARIPCTAIDRYPVVARWRSDVDFVAAGIFCFQPYCVTGELDPPANPLICPQFCLRFNDLDNIGLTGRHYSGFIMIGIQVFNLPDKFIFFKEECVEFNLRWLIEELEVDPDEITLIEDVWAGGGNLGPSIEYFIGGLELGNMVFMQYKTFPDGAREELPVQVIDVGIGMERIPWLMNGTPTSYFDVFPRALEYLRSKVGIEINQDIWAKFGPLSCQLNVDEADDIDVTWQRIAELIGIPTEKVKEAIAPVKELYIVCDHTRTILMAVYDGSLPSNVGGAANIRNMLRRVFALLHRNGWWDKLGMAGFLQLFEQHKLDLAEIYGAFREYKSFDSIIEVEYQRWLTTDETQKEKLQKLLKKNKNQLSMDDWIIAMTSWGIPADKIAEVSGQPVPGNLYYEISQRAERTAKAAETILYSTTHLPPTTNMYYVDHHCYQFDAKIVGVLLNVTQQNVPNILVLDASAFYPHSGGQQHDVGFITLDGKKYEVVNVEKVGKCVLHTISEPLTGFPDEYVGKSVHCEIDEQRRDQLRNHHTSTHIMFAAARRVLGPHVWQNGAKKTVEQAHLDITHYKSLTREEEMGIETEANRIVMRCSNINKSMMAKDVAEKQFGFSLYQGGVVPGNELRIVDIEGIDTEACCGTHCDNTAEVGWIRLLRTQRISDGIVRMYFVAGERALFKQNEEVKIITHLSDTWSIPPSELVTTAERFFDGYKKFGDKVQKQAQKILGLQMKSVLLDPSVSLVLFRSDELVPTLYISNVVGYAEQLKAARKGVVFVGNTFLYGFLGSPELFDVQSLNPLVTSGETGPKNKGLMVQTQVAGKGDKKKKGAAIDNIVEFRAFSLPNANAVVDFLLSRGFQEQ